MYQIKLPIFEGPFDLLLFLIRKHEIDIYDIPITQITREYLEYVQLMQMLDLEVAGEFIEMVATLILIKTRTLLPGTEEDGTEAVEDPRLQLTMQLLQYKRFKETAGYLREFETDQRRFFPRQSKARDEIREKSLQDETLEIDASLFDLMTAFKRALDNMPRITVHEVHPIKITVEDQAGYIIQEFRGKSHLSFHELMTGLPEKIHVIVTFMALLDLMRLGMITAKQNEPFSDIRLVPVGEVTQSRYESAREVRDGRGGSAEESESDSASEGEEAG